MFKSFIAATALIVGSWNPASATPMVLSTVTMPLACADGNVFSVLTTNKGAQFIFKKDGDVDLSKFGEDTVTGAWRVLPYTKDVQVLFEGHVATLTGLQTKKCNAHF